MFNENSRKHRNFPVSHLVLARIVVSFQRCIFAYKLFCFKFGTIMEIRSTRYFNVIPATMIRGVFNLYISNLLGKMYCKYFNHFYINFFFFSNHRKYLEANIY